MSLSDYLLAELRAVAGRPSMRTWLDEASKQEPVALTMSTADAIADARRREG